jgi:chemotaxis protein CheD
VGKTNSSVPQSNIDFVKAFLSMEGIPILSSDVGGDHGRKVIYFPDTGKVFVRKLKAEAEKEILDQERKFKKSLTPVKTEDVTLFG